MNLKGKVYIHIFKYLYKNKIFILIKTCINLNKQKNQKSKLEYVIIFKKLTKFIVIW